MKRIALLSSFLILNIFLYGQKNAQKYVDSLIRSSDVINIEDIRINKYPIYKNGKFSTYNESELKENVCSFSKKNEGYNQLDDYKTLELHFEDATITFGQFMELTFEGFLITGKSKLVIRPYNLHIGLPTDSLKMRLPKTYLNILKDSKPDKEKYYTINSIKTKEKTITGSLIIYVQMYKITKIVFKY